MRQSNLVDWKEIVDQIFIVGTPERSFLAFDAADHVQKISGMIPVIIWNPRTPVMDWMVETHPENLGLQTLTRYAQAGIGHMMALASGLAMNARRMMVLEDDVTFLTDQARLSQILSAVPTDTDVALMDWGALPEHMASLSDRIHTAAGGAAWCRFDRGDIRSTAAYIVSAPGARELLRSYRADYATPPGHMCVPDLRWQEMAVRPDMHMYVAPHRPCIKNILHQHPHSGDPRRLYAQDRHFIGLDRYAVRVKVMRDTATLRKGLYDLIDYTGLNRLTVVEIGSYSGESMEIFLRTGKLSEGHCVDIWTDLYDPIDRASAHMKVVEGVFDRRFQASPQIHKHKGTLSQTVSNLPHAPDLVYIDGDHRYASVMADIDVAISRLDPLFVAGHDYDLPGVHRAVLDSFGGEPDRVFADTSWIVSASRIQAYRDNKTH